MGRIVCTCTWATELAWGSFCTDTLTSVYILLRPLDKIFVRATGSETEI